MPSTAPPSATLKEFLETYPLYRRCLITNLTLGPADVNKPVVQSGEVFPLPIPALLRTCDKCDGQQTFVGRHPPMPWAKTPEFNEPLVQMAYHCAACGESRVFFLLRAEWVPEQPGRLIALKAGQFPPWSINPSRDLANALGEPSLHLYQMGLVCESQGYGIGAFAYYRRVVEEKLGELLDQVRTLLNGVELQQYQEALAKVTGEKRAEDKLRIVKDLLPPALLAGTHNPLQIIYEALSADLHAGTDEACLLSAVEIRTAMEFFTKTLASSRAEERRFSDAMKKILEKRMPKS